jgi:hypothetical protein
LVLGSKHHRVPKGVNIIWWPRPTEDVATTRLTSSQWLKHKQSLLSSLLASYTDASTTPILELMDSYEDNRAPSAIWCPSIDAEPICSVIKDNPIMWKGFIRGPIVEDHLRQHHRQLQQQGERLSNVERSETHEEKKATDLPVMAPTLLANLSSIIGCSEKQLVVLCPYLPPSPSSSSLWHLVYHHVTIMINTFL